MKKNLGFVLLAILLSGCAAASTGSFIEDNGYIIEGDNVHFRDYLINVATDPPGAKIYIDGSYLGKTPFTLRRDGIYNRSAYMNVEAIPLHEGEYPQRKSFPLDYLPHEIYFDMRANPQTGNSNYNMNVNPAQYR